MERYYDTCMDYESCPWKDEPDHLYFYHYEDLFTFGDPEESARYEQNCITS